MKLIALKIGIAILNVIYFFIKLFPIQKNKITFISRQTNEIPIDFKMLINELKNNNPNVKIVTLCKKLEDGLINKIKYAFYMLVQMYNIATSKVVILDSYCIPVCILKQKKKLVVIQIWHALGSLKKFGYSTLGKKDGRDEKLAKVMKMHHNYTYILTSSNSSKEPFREAFNAKLEQMKVMNLPRVDFLQSEEEKNVMQKRFYEKYPEANISPVDYDPGASESNQANRIKLLMTVAKDNLALDEKRRKAIDEENADKKIEEHIILSYSKKRK